MGTPPFLFRSISYFSVAFICSIKEISILISSPVGAGLGGFRCSALRRLNTVNTQYVGV